MDLGIAGKRALVLSSSRGLGLGIAQEFINTGEGASAELGGDGAGAGMVEVDDADKIDFVFLREIAIDTRVVASEGAHSHDCHGNNIFWGQR